MKHTWLLFFLLLHPAIYAQNGLPTGTVLPVRLSTGLNTARIKAGKIIRADVMQDIPGTAIHRGAHVLGRVVNVTPTRLELRFDTLVSKQALIPITTHLRALGSMLEVDEAQIHEEGAGRGLPSALDFTTTQIGGEQDYRSAGVVSRGITRVAQSTAYGALGKLNSNPPCASNDSPQALWLFSTDACGTYGFNDLTIEHSGRTDPVGTIVLVSRAEKINIRVGSGFLLLVQEP